MWLFLLGSLLRQAWQLTVDMDSIDVCCDLPSVILQNHCYSALNLLLLLSP
jgi:hypothetical protein